jgi:hypothetical protein
MNADQEIAKTINHKGHEGTRRKKSEKGRRSEKQNHLPRMNTDDADEENNFTTEARRGGKDFAADLRG